MSVAEKVVVVVGEEGGRGSVADCVAVGELLAVGLGGGGRPGGAVGGAVEWPGDGGGVGEGVGGGCAGHDGALVGRWAWGIMGDGYVS